MNSTYSINETARKRIESVRRKYRQGTLSLGDYLDAVTRACVLRNCNLSRQTVSDEQMTLEIMATAIEGDK